LINFSSYYRDVTTEEVVEYGSGEFQVPNPSSYTLVDSLNFQLIEGGFGFLYILKYDETKGSSVRKDPNLQYWRIYVSFLRKVTDLPTTPSIIYQTTEKLNNMEFKSCFPTYNGEGYKCILSFNNTIINNQTEVNYYQLGFLSSGALLRLDMFPIPINNMHFKLSPLPYGGLLVEHYYKDTAMNGYILNDGKNSLQLWGSYGPEFVHYNKFRTNNTFFGIKKQTGNKLEFVFKSIPKLTNLGKFLVFFFLFPLFKK
jgi:hypothetical protein